MSVLVEMVKFANSDAFAWKLSNREIMVEKFGVRVIVLMNVRI